MLGRGHYNMKVNEKIEKRRIELGLTDTEVARQADMSIYEYGDIEHHSDEIYTLVELKRTKKLCLILHMDIFDLFNMRCAFCEEGDQYLQYYSETRDIIIKKKRKELCLSEEQLGDLIGFESKAIIDMEQYKDYLETWPIGFICELSELINIPIQILIAVRCTRCGR